MANTVSITFQAEDSAVLRAQKRQQQAEKDLQKEMAATGRAADDAAKKIQGAKATAAKPATTVYGGAHGVSPAVLNPDYWKRQKSSIAQVERSLRTPISSMPATSMSVGEMNLLAEAHQRITRDIAARKAMQGREDKFLATARLHNIAPDDFAGIQFQRWKTAQEIRQRRATERNVSNVNPVSPDLYARATGAAASFAGTLSTIATVALSAGSALTGIIGILNSIEATRQEGVNRKVYSAKSIRDLRQIADNPAELQSMLNDVDALRKSFGVDEANAAQTVFTMESAQIRNAGGFKQVMAAHKVGIDADLAVRTLATARRNYGYKGDLDELMSKSILAAGPSMANVGNITAAVGQSAGAWAAIGGDISSQLGSLGVLSDAYKSTDIASERLASLAFQVDKRKGNIKWSHGETPLRGMDLIQNLEGLAKQGKLRSEGGERVTVEKFLQESQAIDAWRKLVLNQKDVTDLTTRIRGAKGGAGSVLNTRANFAIPGTDAVDVLQGSRQGVQIAEEIDAELTMWRTTLQNRRREKMQRKSPLSAKTLAVDEWIENASAPAFSGIFKSADFYNLTTPEERAKIFAGMGRRLTYDESMSRIAEPWERMQQPSTLIAPTQRSHDRELLEGMVPAALTGAQGRAGIAGAMIGLGAGTGNSTTAASASAQAEEANIRLLAGIKSTLDQMLNRMNGTPPTPNRGR